jgi:hypothetical protein
MSYYQGAIRQVRRVLALLLHILNTQCVLSLLNKEHKEQFLKSVFEYQLKKKHNCIHKQSIQTLPSCQKYTYHVVPAKKEVHR